MRLHVSNDYATNLLDYRAAFQKFTAPGVHFCARSRQARQRARRLF
jgi:hypothetical protein